MKCEQMSSLHVPSVDCVLCSKPAKNALPMSCVKFTRGYSATTRVRRSSGNASYPIPSTSRPTPLYKSLRCTRALPPTACMLQYRVSCVEQLHPRQSGSERWTHHDVRETDEQHSHCLLRNDPSRC